MSNSGPNVSGQVNDSGTVGAALAAVEEGVPALAFSSAGDDSGVFFPLADYRAAADFGARLIAGLRSWGLLTTHFALKVVLPRRHHGKPRQGRPVDQRRPRARGLARLRAPLEPTASPSLSASASTGPTTPHRDRPGRRRHRPPSGRGHISVTPVTADRTYGARTADPRELNLLHHYIEQDAPHP